MDSPKFQTSLDNLKFLKFGNIGLICLSIFSCIARSDYNLLCGMILSFLIINYYSIKKKNALRGCIHLIILFIICDLAWIFISLSYWKHSNLEDNVYWKSLTSIHSLVYWIGIFELFIKCCLLIFLLKDFKSVGQFGELKNFNYTNDNSSNIY